MMMNNAGKSGLTVGDYRLCGCSQYASHVVYCNLKSNQSADSLQKVAGRAVIYSEGSLPSLSSAVYF